MFALLLVSLVFAACADKPSAYTLTFETNGGTKIDPITAEAGATVTPPDDPEKEGFVFDGWYLSADFTGEAVSIPSTMPSENVTYYAKFDKIATATLTLNAGLGTLTQTSFELEVGTDVFEYVSAIVPAAPEGLTFGGWFVGESETLLAAGTKLPEAGISLTARYTVPYTVEVYKQTAAGGEEYTLASDVTVDGGSGYVGDKVDISSALGSVTGYTLNAEKTQPITLKAEGGNVYKAYYDLRAYTIYYFDNAPSGAESTGEMPNGTAYYGEESTLPQCAFAIEGYRFAGWSTSASGSVEYAAGEKLPAVKGTVILYACWNRGLKDSNGGGDVLYVLQEQPGKVLLERADMVQTGSYNAEERTFWFGENANDDTLPRGRVSANGENFAYYYGEFELTYSQYDWTEDALVSGVTLQLDGVDKAVYTTSEGTVNGTYRANGSTYSFVSDDGKTGFSFMLGTEDGKDVFLVEDVYSGLYYTYTGSSTSPIAYPVLVLDGYGTLIVMESASTMYTGTYFVEDNTKSILEVSYTGADEETFSGRIQLLVLSMSGQQIRIYMASDALHGTYSFAVEGTRPGTMTVDLNGFGDLAYTFDPDAAGEENVTGDAEYSVLGEYERSEKTYKLFAFSLGSGDSLSVYVLRVDPDGKAERIGTETGDYSEYHASSGYTARIRLYGDGTMSVFFATVSGSYIPVAEGDYEAVAGAEDTYSFKATSFAEGFEELASSVYADFDFRLYTSASGFIMADGNQNKKYSFTTKVDGVDVAFDLTLDGFGMGTIARSGSDASSDVEYFFLDGYDSYTFLRYTDGSTNAALRIAADGTIVYCPDTGVSADGSTNAYVSMAGTYLDDLDRIGVDDERLQLFADGHAIVWVGDVKAAEGTYAAEKDPEGFGFLRYTFTAAAAPAAEYSDYASFSFGYSSAGSLFVYHEGERADLTLWGTAVRLTGYGMAVIGSAQYRYLFAEDGEKTYLELLDSSDSLLVRVIYDPANKTLTEPGQEVGSYYSYLFDEEKNVYVVGEYRLSLDGYLGATLYHLNTEQSAFEPVATGSYTVDGDVYTLTWTTGEVQGFACIASTASTESGEMAVYIVGDDSLEASYTVKDGETVVGTFACDAFGRMTYTAGETVRAAQFVVAESSATGQTLLVAAVSDGEGGAVTSIYLVGADGVTLTATDGMVGKYVLVSGKSILTDQALVLDGIGGAEWTKADGTKVAGTYAPVEESSTEWKFTAKEGGETFVFTLTRVTSTNGDSYSAYIVYDEKTDGTYTSSDWQMVTADGYMTVTFIDFYGNVYLANYESLENGTVLHIFSSALGDLYLRIDEDSFTDITDTYAPEADAA